MQNESVSTAMLQNTLEEASRCPLTPVQAAMVCSFLPAHEKMLLKTIELHCRYNVPTLHLRVTQMYLVVFVFLGIFIIVFYGWTLSFPGILTLTHTQVILKFATPGS